MQSQQPPCWHDEAALRAPPGDARWQRESQVVLETLHFVAEGVVRLQWKQMLSDPSNLQYTMSTCRHASHAKLHQSMGQSLPGQLFHSRSRVLLCCPFQAASTDLQTGYQLIGKRERIVSCLEWPGATVQQYYAPLATAHAAHADAMPRITRSHTL